ncbi:hypothetical protein D9613_006223 [Agrocybe pediades]|uniref:SnoaL-like domain-containing protein n=1 Tax=Agrocybe pediades TaxID=84607 RepID=A0A8H4QUU9_9AGAR|nr:hypothetical protein D9613_006223 [Agrocybe pediades]
MDTEQELLDASRRFFDAFAASQGSSQMLKFFSTTSAAVIQHAPASCPHPYTSRLSGSNAVRSYFDLLGTHWTRSSVKLASALEVDASKRRVSVTAESTWTWKRSGRKFREEFTWTIDYDESMKIVSFIIRTLSGPGTCVMRAVDADPVSEDSPMQAA